MRLDTFRRYLRLGIYYIKWIGFVRLSHDFYWILAEPNRSQPSNRMGARDKRRQGIRSQIECHFNE